MKMMDINRKLIRILEKVYEDTRNTVIGGEEITE